MKAKILFLALGLLVAVPARSQQKLQPIPVMHKWLNSKDVVFTYDGSYMDSTCFQLTVGKKTLKTVGVKAPEKQDLLPGKFFCLSDGTAWQGGSHGSAIFRCGGRPGDVPGYPKPGSDHWKNFLLAVMGKEEARSPFAVAAPLCEVFCLGVVAQRLNRGFSFDPMSKRAIGDVEADALLKGSKGTPRRGWEEFYRV